MGLDGFIWFTGVVEDRNDPDKLGRVRVRCLGYHTEDKKLIPTEDLPWAHVMHPVTDPSMQGMGTTPSFLVEGTWVVGFFMDAKDKQQPMIMGTLPGVPFSKSDPLKGFNDPNGKYPAKSIEHSFHSVGESDVSKLARGVDAEGHGSLIERRGNRAETTVGIETAIKPNIEVVNDKSKTETASTFSEPHPRGVEITDETNTGVYPFNHVYESESGHIQEIDDTPNGERLLTQHKSGTYEEIVADGTKTIKVVGDNYEMVVGGTNIFIQGDVNMTTYGTKREYIEDDYILEVGGDFTRLVYGNEQVKIGAAGAGNLEEVVMGNHAYNISGAVKGSIGTDDTAQSRDYDLNIGGNFGTNVGGDHFITSIGNMTLTSAESLGMISLKTTSITAASATDGNVAIIAGTSLDMKSTGKMTIKSEDEVDIDGTEINLN